MHKILLILLSGLLTACAARTSLPPMPEQALKAKRYQVEITAHDGGRIAATVWQPALAANTDAPLIMHTHGFGLGRMKGNVGLYANIMPSGRMARQLWKQGFWLITWDQRGHGDTDGVINVMDPKKEVRDVTTLLDWAEQNIPRLQRDAQGDIRVGMIGESYGGGVQLMAITQENRIDAIVPMTTWHDLRQSLAPSDVPKGGWIKLLYMMGDWWNFRKLHPYLREGFANARKGIVEEELKERYASHGLVHYCNDEFSTRADVLLLQGFRDVLFPVDEALHSMDCLQTAGANVTLIAQSGGHILPLEQPSWKPIWYRDTWLHCGNEKRRTDTVLTEWLASRLTGQSGPDLPAICVSTNGRGSNLERWPENHQTLALAPVNLTGKRSGSWRWLTGTGDWLTGWRTRNSLASRFAEPRDGRLRPAMTPVLTAQAHEHLIGTPVLQLQADTTLPVLAAIGVRKAGSARFKLVNEQMTAVRPGIETPLPPITIQLEPGDQLAVLLFSRHPQFNTLPMDFGNGTTFQGHIRLPGLAEQETRKTADALR